MSYNTLKVIENGDQFFESLRSDVNSRYKSWEHCYSIFSKYRGESLSCDHLDLLALHLAFYLASWGMYRGSSFLLQKDYQVHIEAIKELMNHEHLELWAIKSRDYCDNNNRITKLFELTKRLKIIYAGIRRSANDSINRPMPNLPISDTLITKILLGTLGCVPAYDRYFCDGVKKCAVASTLYNPKGIYNMSKYYVDNEEYFEKWRNKISSKNIEYPQMKVLDMCFWQIGYNTDVNNKQ